MIGPSVTRQKNCYDLVWVQSNDSLFLAETLPEENKERHGPSLPKKRGVVIFKETCIRIIKSYNPQTVVKHHASHITTLPE